MLVIFVAHLVLTNGCLGCSGREENKLSFWDRSSCILRALGAAPARQLAACRSSSVCSLLPTSSCQHSRSQPGPEADHNNPNPGRTAANGPRFVGSPLFHCLSPPRLFVMSSLTGVAVGPTNPWTDCTWNMSVHRRVTTTTSQALPPTRAGLVPFCKQHTIMHMSNVQPEYIRVSVDST